MVGAWSLTSSQRLRGFIPPEQLRVWWQMKSPYANNWYRPGVNMTQRNFSEQSNKDLIGASSMPQTTESLLYILLFIALLGLHIQAMSSHHWGKVPLGSMSGLMLWCGSPRCLNLALIRTRLPIECTSTCPWLPLSERVRSWCMLNDGQGLTMSFLMVQWFY